MTNEPEWLEEIYEALDLTDGVDNWEARDKDDETVITINYGEETLEFTAGTDGEQHGAKYDDGIFDLTSSEEMQWWIAVQLYMRLQKAKRDMEEMRIKHELNP